MNYRWGYVRKGIQKRLTPKSRFLKELEKAQTSAKIPEPATIEVEFGPVPTVYPKLRIVRC